MAQLIVAGQATATMSQSPIKMTDLAAQDAVNMIEGKPFQADIRRRFHVVGRKDRRAVHLVLAVGQPRQGQLDNLNGRARYSSSAGPAPCHG